jgi:hypothetical protein
MALLNYIVMQMICLNNLPKNKNCYDFLNIGYNVQWVFLNIWSLVDSFQIISLVFIIYKNIVM